MNFQKVEFLISAASTKDFPKERLPEIAFAGKSNVGKSSVINRLLQRKNFARVGEKPGKTIHVNYFTVDKKCYLVDLPGYGFAKVSQAEKDRWGKLMEEYFAAQRIRLGVFIVDARHAPTMNDVTMARWFLDSGCPFVVVANKLDKLKKSEILPNLATIREDLELPDEVPVIPFSAGKGTGRDELVKYILAAAEA
jgi:GTP-binding protein